MYAFLTSTLNLLQIAYDNYDKKIMIVEMLVAFLLSPCHFPSFSLP